MKKISWDSRAESLTDEERQHLRKVQEARSDAITFLGLAKKPSGKIVQRLRDEGYEEPIIKEVVQELQDEGYLDDLLIARRMVRQRSGRQAESRFALRQRMLQAGLSPEAADTTIAEAMSDHELASDLIGSRFGSELEEIHQTGKGLREQQSLMKKIARFLISRGFDSELVAQLLRLREED